MTGLRERLSEPLHAISAVFRNPNLRRLELAWTGSVIGEWASVVALAVFAFQSGGTAAVGVVVLVRMASAAVAAPFASLLGDRFRRERIMLAADLVRAFAIAGAAAAASLDAPTGVVFALAGAVAAVSTAFRPAQAAIVPSLAASPEELTAANVTSTTIESVGFFVGPALGGLLLAATSPPVVFAAQAGAFLWSASLVRGITAQPLPGSEEALRGRSVFRELVRGFETVAVDDRLRLLVGMFVAQTLVAGALNVLVVVTALDLLDIGQAGVGFLSSADGIGGVIGAVAVVALVGRRRLASAFGAGIVLWGLPIALIGVFPEPAAAFALLALVGLGNTLVDVAGFTLLQRAVANDVLARVFGALESLGRGAIGLGGIVAPLLVSWLGIRGALIAAGAFLPALAAVLWPRLTRLDALAPVPGRELELLRSVPLFTPLPPATLDRLASSLEPVRVAAGAAVVRQGEPGDRFYVVGAGEMDVTVDGTKASTLGPGDYFGEIALLRDVPRTATVAARVDALLYALERDEFIAAVTGHPPSADAADAVIATRLGSLRPQIASL